MKEINETATQQEWNMSNQDLNEKLIDSLCWLQMFKVHYYTKSMIQAIIDHQIAHVCETDKMADIHIVVTLI